jgi:two-component system sensor histidine kinase TctE
MTGGCYTIESRGAQHRRRIRLASQDDTKRHRDEEATMMQAQRRPISIRRRLLLFLASALLLLVVGAASVTYWVALRAANNAYDRALLDPTVDMAQNIRTDQGRVTLDLPQKALEALLYDQVDKVIFQVRGPDGAVVAGLPDIPRAPAIDGAAYRFLDVTYGGERFRVAALRTLHGATIQVGETRQKRNRLIWEIMVAETSLAVLIALSAIGLAWMGVARGLSRLSRVRSELMRRSPDDLRPIDATHAPEEIAPLVDAFNRLLAQLKEASSMQQRFLADAAHQLRTPLAGLQMHLELLLRHDLTEEVRLEVERLHGASVRASRLANQLLALAKAESAQRADAVEPVDLYTVADTAAREWVQHAAARKIDLGFALEPAVFPGDPLLLRELINNLVDNALRYTPAGGSVTIKTGREGSSQFISVDDTGPAFPMSNAARSLSASAGFPARPETDRASGLPLSRKLSIGTEADWTSDRASGAAPGYARPSQAAPRRLPVELSPLQGAQLS